MGTWELVWKFLRYMLLNNSNCTYHKNEVALKVGAAVLLCKNVHKVNVKIKK